MNNKIVYFTNGYIPDREGGSKELYALHSHFFGKYNNRVLLHNLADRWKFDYKRGLVSYPDKLLPLGFPFIKYLERTSQIAHIFGSLTGRIYLKFIKKNPCILTSTSAIIEDRIEECKPFWKRLNVIVLESEYDLQTVRQAGIDENKLHLIYPGVEYYDLPHIPLTEKFTILFASAPISKNPESFNNRGLEVLIEAAKRLKECKFIFLWRGMYASKLKKMIADTGAGNIKVVNKIIPDIVDIQKIIHCTILCPLTNDECKPCPNSILESLSCGRPVLVSDKVGISNIIEKEGCGVVAQPSPSSIEEGINTIRIGYECYKTKAVSVAKKYFAQERFIKAYEKLYEKVGLQNIH